MDFRVKPITSGQLTGSASTFYTAPTTCRSVLIKKLTLCNTDTNPYTFTGYRVPSGGSAGVTNEVYNAEPIAASATMDLDQFIGQSLAPGDFIQLFASTASKLTLTGTVVEFY